VTKLIERHRQLVRENTTLRSALEEKYRRVRELDVKVLDANQRRQDVVKRIDELITQIDHLGAQLDAQAESLNQ
jgi:translation initiation factor 2B subunit (eIF-2B alpha/beta/delta family)